jgi:hypothetical protein
VGGRSTLRCPGSGSREGWLDSVLEEGLQEESLRLLQVLQGFLGSVAMTLAAVQLHDPGQEATGSVRAFPGNDLDAVRERHEVIKLRHSLLAVVSGGRSSSPPWKYTPWEGNGAWRPWPAMIGLPRGVLHPCGVPGSALSSGDRPQEPPLGRSPTSLGASGSEKAQSRWFGQEHRSSAEGARTPVLDSPGPGYGTGPRHGRGCGSRASLRSGGV